MGVRTMAAVRDFANRWPHIGRFLRIDDSTGWINGEFHRWDWWIRDAAERADGYEEWADFYEWHLGQRVDELAGDHRKRNHVERWTADMAYCVRRCAAYARGEDPGEPVPLAVRRPDLEAAHRAIVAELVAELNARRCRRAA